STSIRREGYATVTATATSADTFEETVTSDTIRRLGLAADSEMVAQLPSNVGAFQPDGNRDGDHQWLIHPSGIAFVGGKPAGEPDDAASFSVGLPGGGMYVITAKMESLDSRGYGSRQPVVVETGQTIQLAPIMLSLTTFPEAPAAP